MNDVIETWKPIAAYDGRYEVSSLGRVRSLYIHLTTPRSAPLILAPGLDTKRGHLKVSLSLDGVSKTHAVHGLVAEAFLGPKPCPEAEVKHKDTVEANNRADNLEYVIRRHGMKHSPEYRSWRAMIQRCTGPNHQAYDRYGGRGITVHPTWLTSFTQFFRDVGPRPADCSLDRIDNNGNYEPGNVRWATRKEQARNRKKNTLLTINGRTQCLQAWADEAGLDKNCLIGRVKTGRPEQELLAPVGSLRNVANRRRP